MAAVSTGNDGNENEYISLNSTDDEGDLSKEYEIERILAQRRTKNGTECLVRWHDYPLAEATWEPRKRLPPAVLKDWKAQRARIKAGQEERFKIREWKEKRVQQLRGKHIRHAKRNDLRAKLGLDKSDWSKSLDEMIKEIEDGYQSDDTDDDSSITYQSPVPTSSPPKQSPTQLQGRHSRTSQVAAASSLLEEEPVEFQSSSKRNQGDIAFVEIPSSPTTATKPNGVAQMLGVSKTTLPALSERRPAAKETPQSLFIQRRSSTEKPAENVFTGGTTRKKRITLSEIAADTSKEPKFLKHRHRRQLEKASRDRENEAPPLTPQRMISLDSVAAQTTLMSSQQPQAQEHPAPEADENQSEPAPSLPQRSALKRTISSQHFEATRPPEPARRKSVHFLETVQAREPSPEPSLFIENESDDPNDSIGGNEQSQSPEGIMRPPTPPLGQPKDGLGSHAQLHSVPKKCHLGSGSGKELLLLFNNISQDMSVGWLAKFKSQASLNFSHMCVVQSFAAQFRLGLAPHPILAMGAVSAVTEQTALDTIADRLRSTAQGIICHGGDFCIMIFPQQPNEWNIEADIAFGKHTSVKYVVFHPGEMKQEDLAPEKSETESQLGLNGLPKGLGQLYGLNFRIVCPPKLQTSKKHHFFLAFPWNALEQARLIASWLKLASTAEVECVIFDSFSPGGWSQYLEESSQVGGGGVIIHEDALWKIRRLPGMFEVLSNTNSGRSTVSVFKTSTRETVASDWTDKPSVIGDFSLRLLALPGKMGKIFLLTPGFIVSKPKQASQFMVWFASIYGKEDAAFKGKLAIPADFVDWLGLLLAGEIKRVDGIGEPKEHLTKIAYTIIRLQRSEETRHVLEVAPAGIDPNDEQSLVNWLGWWSILNLDQYGRSYVCGSDHTVNNFTVRIDPPRYEEGTMNDPETPLKLLDADQSVVSTNDVVVPKAPRPVPLRTGDYELVPNDEAITLQNFLQSLQMDLLKRNTPLWLYFRPVSHWRPDMAFNLGDMRGNWATTSEWFNKLNPFADCPKEKGVMARNSYLSFFYTPVENGSLGNENPKKAIEYRPWIGVLRPVNPHRRPWLKTEMYIWDMAYQGRFRGDQNVRLQDLDPVHRTVLELVSKRNGYKNPGMPLKKVWVGGWDQLETEFTNPLDITLDYLNKFTRDVKHWVPAPNFAIPTRGWKFVKAGDADDEDRRDAGGDVIMDVDQQDEQVENIAGTNKEQSGEEDDDDEDAEPRKIIFHPPQGHRKGIGGTSVCRNILYSRSRTANHKSGGQPFDYTFPLTTSWYGQQVAEGRDFKHMMVDTWKKVFDQLKVATDE